MITFNGFHYVEGTDGRGRLEARLTDDGVSASAWTRTATIRVSADQLRAMKAFGVWSRLRRWQGEGRPSSWSLQALRRAVRRRRR